VDLMQSELFSEFRESGVRIDSHVEYPTCEIMTCLFHRCAVIARGRVEERLMLGVLSCRASFKEGPMDSFMRFQ
jgi:hypothetical protein